MRDPVLTRRRKTISIAMACVALTALPACQQGASPMGGTMGSQFGATSGTPMGPSFGGGNVMPASSGANLGANPFNTGPTRVTPPPTGSIGSAAALGTPVPGAGTGLNPYLGAQNQGTQNIGSQNIGSQGQFQNSIIPNRSFTNQSPIGSGVAPVGWTETASNFSADSRFGSPNLSSLANGYRDPARSGMRVIDMTGAPNPPGYRPSPNANSSLNANLMAGQFGSQRNFGNQRPVVNASVPTYSPAPPVQIASASPPAFRGGQSIDPSYNAPASFQQQRPAAPATLPSPNRDASAHSVPSTEPLQWRRPGTGF